MEEFVEELFGHFQSENHHFAAACVAMIYRKDLDGAIAAFDLLERAIELKSGAEFEDLIDQRENLLRGEKSNVSTPCSLESK